jgi:hypothetical protein
MSVKRKIFCVGLILVFSLSARSLFAQKILIYQESPGVTRWARLDGTKIASQVLSIESAFQPRWLVSKNGTDWDGPFEWLTYLGTDGNIWLTKVNAGTDRTSPHVIFLHFESKKEDDSGNNPTFQIVNPDGSKWNVNFTLSTPTDESAKESGSVDVYDKHPLLPITFSLASIN